MYDDVSLKTKLCQTKLNHLGSYSEPFLGHKTRLHLYLFYRYRVFSRLYSLIYALFSVDWTCRIPSTIIINSRERTERPGLRDENVRPRRTFITATINDAARRWNESPQNDSETQYSDCCTDWFAFVQQLQKRWHCQPVDARLWHSFTVVAAFVD